MMLGNMRGIVTDYKKLANGKREIPISSCPPYVELALYGTGGAKGELNNPTETDVDSNRKTARKPSKTRYISRYDKMRKIRQSFPGGNPEICFATVDTENRFTAMGARWRIDLSVDVYRPKLTDEGLLYDMDKIMCACSIGGDIRFFDMNLEEIPRALVSKEE